MDHTAQEGGAESALLRVAQRIGEADLTVRALLFEDGPFRERLTSAGITTAILSLDSHTNRTSRDRVLSPVTALRTAAATLGFVPRLVRGIRGSQCDLVVANSLKSAVLVSLAAPLAGRRWVWHLHDRLARDYLPGPLVRLMRVLALAGPRRIVVNSEATRDTLPSRARRKAVIAYPGLPPEAFEVAEPDVHHPVVTVIGRISPTKGQREFLEAAAALAQTRPDVRFRIVGAALFAEQEYADALPALAERLGLDSSVIFTGWVSDPGAELRASTVLVHASPVPEPFGQVVAEAMAAGIPVVASDAGGVREMLVPDGGREDAPAPVRTTELGVLVRPGDASALATGITLVLQDPDAAAQRARAARAVAGARFGIDDTVAVIREAWLTAAPGHR
ncbi:glycosyltransferase [Microbacterium kyungheense]|uniref:glycosyltransferase n=1 Tax=Microbacterium kyungheense TaxID=1263636 RepID=UPI00163CE9D2|nr:glycosyltransferase [Microbacterium kyungheense]